MAAQRRGGIEDRIAVKNTKSWFTIEQKFSVGGKAVKLASLDSNGKVVLASKQIVHATATDIKLTPVR